MRRTVIKILRPLHATSIENGVGVGTPDVAYAGGWLELKSIDAWPKKPDTPLRVPHFSPAQKVWITKHRLAGGVVDVLLKVEQDWLLIDGQMAVDILGVAPREALIFHAVRHWPDGIDKSLISELDARRGHSE